MHALEALWNGQLCPREQMEYQTEEYYDFAALFERNEGKLQASLNPQQQELLRNLLNAQEGMERIREHAAFAEGFRIAVQLLTESV